MGNNNTVKHIDHDPGKIHYREHNIYLNFIGTYDRLPPTYPITIHQKAFFLFWTSTLIIWSLLQLLKIFLPLKEDEKGKTDKIEKKPDKISPARIRRSLSPNCSPSKRTDYLDAEAFLQNKDDMQQNALSGGGQHTLEVEDPYQPPLTIFEQICHNVHTVLTSVDAEQPPFEQFVLKMFVFGCFLFYIFLTDYLHIWPKVDKQYSRDMFVFLFFALVFVAFLFTIRTTKDKFLNRDQTEEWKGWMQVQFVWYHYFDAQETFNSIRCYVGAYVWMTGFGNYIYFSTRKDYSVFRLLKMLFRLNFLVLCVMAMSNHEFVRYYICAMHTYWFLSVWAVMVAFNRYNDNPKFMMLKFGVYALVNACIFNIPGADDLVFKPFLRVLHDKDGGLRYWKYRAWLDHWSCLVGMLVAFNYRHLEKFLIYLDTKQTKVKAREKEVLRAVVTVSLLAVFAVWFYFVLAKPKEPYLLLHPFTSPVPIVIYALLRNLHPVLRTRYLNLFTWLGKITLETYLSQIHIYMMGDAKTILVYLPHYPMLNFTISTLIYVTFSYFLFKLTVFFSAYIFPRNLQVVTKNICAGAFWMGTCYTLAYLLTRAGLWRSDKSGLEALRWNITKY